MKELGCLGAANGKPVGVSAQNFVGEDAMFGSQSKPTQPACTGRVHPRNKSVEQGTGDTRRATVPCCRQAVID